jgi:hypothetical protein
MKEIKRKPGMPLTAKFMTYDIMVLFWKRKPHINVHELWCAANEKPMASRHYKSSTILKRGEIAKVVET